MRRVLLFSLIILSGFGMVTAVFAQLSPQTPNESSEPLWTEYPAAEQSLLLEFIELDADPTDSDLGFPFGGSTPANDSCNTATLITFSGNPVGGTTNVTDMEQAINDPLLSCMWGTEDGHDLRGHNSVWYTFVAPSNGIVTIDTVSSNYDTVVAVFTGICGTLNQVACNDDFAGFTSRLTFNIKEGETYFVEVVSWDDQGPSQKTLNAVLQSEPIESQWQLRTSIQSPARTGAAGVVVGSGFYQFGGQDSAGDISNDIYKYETTNNSWSKFSSILPNPRRRYFSAAQVGNRIYLPGGDTAVNAISGITAKHHAFDLGLNLPDELTDLPVPVAWSQSLAVPGDNNGYYVIGGFNNKWDTYPTVGVSMTTNALNTIWRYDIGSNGWTTETTTMITPRFGHTAAYFNGQICVMGGLNSNLELLVSGECWSPGGSSGFINSTNVVRFGASSAVSPDGRWFIFGGLDSNQAPVSEVEVLYPGSTNWQLLDVSYDLGGTINNNPRTRPNGGFVGYDLYAIGGSETDSNLAPVVNSNVERLFTVGGQTTYLPIILGRDNSSFDDNFSVARPIVMNTSQNGRFHESTDFYSFYTFNVANDNSVVNVNLTNIPFEHDYNLYIFDNNKQLLASSENAGNQSEMAQAIMDAGQYYVMVKRILPNFDDSTFNIAISN